MKSRPSPPQRLSKPRRSSPLVWIVVPLLAVALVAQTNRLRDHLAAGRILRQVELVSMAAIARGDAPRGLFPANLELLRQAAALDPGEIGIPIARGTQYLLAGNPYQAAAAYRGALELEPRPEVYLNLGRALAAAGRMDEARQSIRTALRLDPSLAPTVPPELR